MPYNFISRINKIACNEPNPFILKDRRCCPIGYIAIMKVDRDAADSN